MQYLYETIFYSKEVNELFSNEAIITAMLRFESALAKAQAKHNIIPVSAAEVIEKSCSIEKIDIEQLIKEAGDGGNINIPLVRQLTSVVKKQNDESSRYVHFGATSQDVIDTALMIQLQSAVQLIAQDLEQIIKQLVALTKEHRATIMIGRSFLQHARPITFGFKTAGWLDALLRSKQAIQNLLKENFVLQLGGAVGTLSAMNRKGLQVGEAMGLELGLDLPTKPWHTQRDRFAIIAATLGILSGNIAKMGKDISLLSQTEIAEVTEAFEKGKGGSSSMPHKKNQVGCISILANTERIPGLVSTILSSVVQDHERATGLWHAEWQTIIDIIQLTAGSVSKAVKITNGLEVNKEQMLRNLEITRGLIYAENVSLALAPMIGKAEAHELLEQCSRESVSKNVHLKDLCMKHPVISTNLKPGEIEKLFDHTLSLGICDVFIDRVLNKNFSS